MRYEYKTENTCSQIISFDIDGNVITNIEFYGGCNGNLKVIAKLLEGATCRGNRRKAPWEYLRSPSYFMYRSACTRSKKSV